jgi:hypothetical protein
MNGIITQCIYEVNFNHKTYNHFAAAKPLTSLVHFPLLWALVSSF